MQPWLGPSPVLASISSPSWGCPKGVWVSRQVGQISQGPGGVKTWLLGLEPIQGAWRCTRGCGKGFPLSASESGSHPGLSAPERPGRVCTVEREDPGRVEKDGREASRESQRALMWPGKGQLWPRLPRQGSVGSPQGRRRVARHSEVQAGGSGGSGRLGGWRVWPVGEQPAAWGAVFLGGGESPL